MSDNKNEVGIDAKWSTSGFGLRAISRLASALDRRSANKVSAGGLNEDRKVSVETALTEAHVSLIQGAQKALADAISQSPEKAARLLSAYSRMEKDSANIDACLDLMQVDLQHQSSAQLSQDNGPAVLDQRMLNRWERYAAEADETEAREKWAKVLSSEILNPGSFSVKTMRIVDELNSETAQLFEKFVSKMFKNIVFQLMNPLDDKEIDTLVEAELIIRDELPRTFSWPTTTDSEDHEFWMLAIDKVGVVIKKDAELPGIPRNRGIPDPVSIDLNGDLRFACVVPTGVGLSLSRIIDRPDELALMRELRSKLIELGSAEAVRLVKDNGNGRMSHVDE